MFHKVFYDDVKNTSDEILHKDYSMYGNTYVKVITQEKENHTHLICSWINFIKRIYRSTDSR